MTVLVCELMDMTRAQLDTILESQDLPKATENTENQLEILLDVQLALVFDIEIQKSLYQIRLVNGKYINQTKKGDFQPFKFNKIA